jgi:ABC-2 type transport system permease protein
MAGRCIRLSARNVDALVTSLMPPVLLMVVFVYLVGGAIDTGTTYVDYVVPGVIVLCAGFGPATTAVTVSQDMQGAVVDRRRSCSPSRC